MKFTTLLLFSSLLLLSTPAFAQSPDPPPTNQSEAYERYYNQHSLYAPHLNLPSLDIPDIYLDDSWFSPQLGPHGPSITSRQFYQIIGDPDLLAQYDSNYFKKNISLVLLGGGALVGIASSYLTIVSALWDRRGDIKYVIPLSALGVSIAAIIVGAIMYPDEIHPLKANEAADRINTHNNNIKDKLGLPHDALPTSTVPRLKYDINLAAGPHSAELRLKLDF